MKWFRRVTVILKKNDFDTVSAKHAAKQVKGKSAWP